MYQSTLSCNIFYFFLNVLINSISILIYYMCINKQDDEQKKKIISNIIIRYNNYNNYCYMTNK